MPLRPTMSDALEHSPAPGAVLTQPAVLHRRCSARRQKWQRIRALYRLPSGSRRLVSFRTSQLLRCTLEQSHNACHHHCSLATFVAQAGPQYPSLPVSGIHISRGCSREGCSCMVTTTSEKDGDAAGCWTMAYTRAHFHELPVSSSIQQYPAVSCSIPVSDAPAPSIAVKILRDTAMATLLQ